MKKISILFFCLNFFVLVLAQPTPTSNVGIGTTTPTRAKLEVHGAVGNTSGIFGGEGSGISLQSNRPGIGYNEYFSTSSKYMSIGYAAKMFFVPGTGDLYIDMFVNGSKDANTIYSARALSIANNGNIGIRPFLDNVNVTLEVRKSGNFDGSAVFGGTSYNSHFNYGNSEDTYIRGGKVGSKVIINDLSGGKIIFGSSLSTVGINSGLTPYPLEIQQVNGRGLALVEPNNNFNNWEIRVQRSSLDPDFGSDLNFLYNGQYKSMLRAINGEHLNYSDRRLKTKIEAMPSLLNKFMQLQPVTYQMKYHNANHEKTIGFIAQDVKQLFPELVCIITDTSRSYQGITDLHGVNYNGFHVLTIKAIQEQQQLIKKMQEQNEGLSRRIEMAEIILNAKK